MLDAGVFNIKGKASSFRKQGEVECMWQLKQLKRLYEVESVQLRKRFLAKGIPIRIGVESIEDIRAEAAAANGMRENE